MEHVSLHLAPSISQQTLQTTLALRLRSGSAIRTLANGLLTLSRECWGELRDELVHRVCGGSVMTTQATQAAQLDPTSRIRAQPDGLGIWRILPTTVLLDRGRCWITFSPEMPLPQ